MNQINAQSNLWTHADKYLIRYLLFFVLIAFFLTVIDAQGQVVDAFPTFRDHCQTILGNNKPDSVVSYNRPGTRIVISSDTTITTDWWIGNDTVLIIPKYRTIYFWPEKRLIVNTGGILQIGDPTPPQPPASTLGLRPPEQDCDCGQVAMTCSTADSSWKGILVKQSATAYIYGVDISLAKQGIFVQGEPSPSGNWCEDPPNLDGSPTFVWVECNRLYDPDTLKGAKPERSAGIYLHGKAASHTVVNRTSVFCDRKWLEGIAVRGDSAFGPCRAPNIGSCYVQDAAHAAFHVVHNQQVCGGISEYTEVVGHGWYAYEPKTAGVKVYGAARCRFTECEGGLIVESGNTAIHEQSIYINSGDHYNASGVRYAGLYMNNFMSRLELINPQEDNIRCIRGQRLSTPVMYYP